MSGTASLPSATSRTSPKRKWARIRIGLSDEKPPPNQGMSFEVAWDALLVPDYEYLSGELFRAAATKGVENSEA
jgi:hypothetical protein